MMTDKAKNLEQRLKAVRANGRQFLIADYEMVSMALDVEINPELTPPRLIRIIKARLEQMSKRERETVPNLVWSVIDAMDVTNVGLRKFNPHTPTPGQETQSGWFTIEFQTPDTYLVVPTNAKPAAFLKTLRSKERFKAWEAVHNPKIEVVEDRIAVSCEILRELPTKFVRTLLASF